LYNEDILRSTKFTQFLPRDATQSEILLRQVVCPSLCPSVFDVEVSWSHRLEFFENNYTVS